MKIPYVRPSIGAREVELVAEAASCGWGSNSNFYIEKFEENFTSWIDISYGVATSSCTGAIELALAAIELSCEDEVILADSNWIATVAPIVRRGAKPIFVDILEDTWCLDPSKVQDAITSRTKAIIATHLYGNLCDLTTLKQIAETHGLFLIEDAAEAIGSYYEKRHAGTIGDIGVFSFHGSKTLTTGEGGMLVTNHQELAERVRVLNNHGRSPREERQFFPSEIGFKFKMSNVQAALGIAQLARIDELVSKKRYILNEYRKAIAGLDCISINPIQPACESGAWMPNITYSRSSGITREILIRRFQDAQIDARVFFWPLSSLGLFKPDEPSKNIIAHSVASRSINLPSFHDMTDQEIETVIEVFSSLSR